MTEHRKLYFHPFFAVSYHSIHFQFLHDLSCNKLKEKEKEETMNKKKRKVK